MKVSFLPGVARKEGTPPRADNSRARWEVALSDRTPGKKPSNDLGGPLRVIASAILIFLISQIIAVFIAQLAISVFNPHSHASLDNSIPGQFTYILIAEALAAYFAIKLVQRKGLSLSFIGLGRRPKLSDLAKAGIGFAAFWAVLIVLSIIISNISPDLNNEKQNLGFDNISTGTQNALAFIALVIIPPLGEETLIRGYLYSGLRKIWRFWPAVAVTSLLFGLAHLEFGSGGPLVWAAALDTFFLSIVLCFLREKTGALYAGMLVHMLNNLIAFHFAFK